MTALLTPGHTRGCTSWRTTVIENEQTVRRLPLQRHRPRLSARQEREVPGDPGRLPPLHRPPPPSRPRHLPRQPPLILRPLPKRTGTEGQSLRPEGRAGPPSRRSVEGAAGAGGEAGEVGAAGRVSISRRRLDLHELRRTATGADFLIGLEPATSGVTGRRSDEWSLRTLLGRTPLQVRAKRKHLAETGGSPRSTSGLHVDQVVAPLALDQLRYGSTPARDGSCGTMMRMGCLPVRMRWRVR